MKGEEEVNRNQEEKGEEENERQRVTMKAFQQTAADQHLHNTGCGQRRNFLWLRHS